MSMKQQKKKGAFGSKLKKGAYGSKTKKGAFGSYTPPKKTY